MKKKSGKEYGGGGGGQNVRVIHTIVLIFCGYEARKRVTTSV